MGQIARIADQLSKIVAIITQLSLHIPQNNIKYIKHMPIDVHLNLSAFFDIYCVQTKNIIYIYW